VFAGLRRTMVVVSIQFLLMEVFVTAIQDALPRCNHIRRILAAAVVAFVSFMLTLPFLTQVRETKDKRQVYLYFGHMVQRRAVSTLLCMILHKKQQLDWQIYY